MAAVYIDFWWWRSGIEHSTEFTCTAWLTSLSPALMRLQHWEGVYVGSISISTAHAGTSIIVCRNLQPGEVRLDSVRRRTSVVSCVLLCTGHFPIQSHGKILHIASRQHSMSRPQSSS